MQLYDSQGRHLYLTADERRAFIAAAVMADRPVRTLCTVLHDTGCRISEALALTPEHIDLSGRVVMFESLKKRRRGIYRAMPVPPTLLDTLDMVHGIREAQKRGGGQSDRLLWSWTRNTAWRHVKTVMAGWNSGRPSPLAQGTAPRLRRPRHQLGRAAQHAFEVDGPCHP